MVSRKSHRKHKSHRRQSRKEGGAMLNGAPLSYSLADDWSSKMSNGQGGDYLKYHVNQHGGALGGAPLSAIGSSALPSSMSGPAMQNGIHQAYAAIAGLKDQAGGKRRKNMKKHGGSRRKSSKRSKKHGGSRRKSSKRSKKHGGSRRKSSKRSKKHGGSRRKRSTRRSKGGALGYAPVSAGTMLLGGADYAKAGLTPEWKSGVEFDAAKMRQAM